MFYLQYDGSVVVWDLREVSSLHKSGLRGSDGMEHTLRHPTYNTAGVLAEEENHQTAVIALQPIAAPGTDR